MSYDRSPLGIDVPDDLISSQQNVSDPEKIDTAMPPMPALPVVPSPSDLIPVSPPPPQKTFMEKLEEVGPLGWTWKTWIQGAAAVAVVRYMMTRRAVSPNKRKRRQR